jgi:hypothetical protein
MTLDADVALPGGLKVKGQDIHERLTASGFQAEFLGHHKPPATHYQLSDQSGGFYAEFLTPLIGGAYARGGKRSATTHRWGSFPETSARRPSSLLALDGRPVRLGWLYLCKRKTSACCKSVTFLAQKVLVYTKRNRSERAKDILYIHDTFETFGALIADLREEWINKIRSRLHPRSVGLVERAADTLFGGMSDPVREASRIVQDRALSPQAIREVCSFGFKQVFRASD